MAKLLGVKRQNTYAQLERGTCNEATAIKIADILDLEVNEFCTTRTVKVNRIELNVEMARQDMSISRLAALSGVKYFTISNIKRKNGECACNLNTLIKIANALNVDIKKLIMENRKDDENDVCGQA